MVFTAAYGWLLLCRKLVEGSEFAMSAILIVNGVEFPPPKRGNFNIIIETNVNAGRNANAAAVGTVIGRNQYKIDGTEWAGLDADTWHRMLAAVKDVYIPVTFENPETGEFTTITMYRQPNGKTVVV